MLGDMTRLTTRSHQGRESKGGQCGIGAHMEACRGVGVQETEMACQGRGPKKQLSRRNWKPDNIFPLESPLSVTPLEA